MRSGVHALAEAHGLLDDTAKHISPEWQIRHVAAWQKWVDNGVSKTINLPASATIEDVVIAFKLAWQLKCKGITVYRDGSKTKQVVTSQSTTRYEIAPVRKYSTDPGVRDGHNVERFGTTLDFQTGCGRIHITCNERDRDTGIPFEVFNLTAGGCTAMGEAIGKLISKYVHDPRLSGDELATVERIVKTLRKVKCTTAMQNPNSQGKSCPDIIAKRMHQVWIHKSVQPKRADDDNNSGKVSVEECAVCPQCGAPATFGLGCRSGSCTNCGWSGCS